MAIDRSTFDYYKFGYVSYVNNLKAYNIKGKCAEEVERNYNRMLELGEECNSETEFKDKLEKENVLANLYNYYNQAVIEYNAKNNVNANAYANANSNVGNESTSTTTGRANPVVNTILNTTVTPLLYRIPVVGTLIMPISSLVKLVIGLVRNNRSKKSKKTNNVSANASSTHIRRTS